MKKLSLIILIMCAAAIADAQLKMSDLDYFPLGKMFSERKLIESSFKSEASIMKADFLGAYRIEYENTPFDFYGNANYRIQFVKEKLSNVDIEFSFKADQLLEFERLLKQLMADLKVDTGKRLVKEYNTLNIPKTIEYVKKECKLTTPKNQKGYKEINTKDFGISAWAITSGESDYRFLLINCTLSENHLMQQDGYNRKTYDGGIVTVSISLSNQELQKLKNLEINQDVHHYTTYKEGSSQ